MYSKLSVYLRSTPSLVPLKLHVWQDTNVIITTISIIIIIIIN